MTDIIQSKGDVVEAVIDDELILMSTRNGHYYTLNPIGSSIWRKITGPVSVQSVCEQLLQEYDVSEQDCQHQVLDFIQHLGNRKLLTVTKYS